MSPSGPTVSDGLSMRSREGERPQGRLLDFALLAIVCAIATALILHATRSGPGITPDSTTYLNMADNIRLGRGFVIDVAGPFDLDAQQPVTVFSPGYPLLITLLLQLGASSVAAARIASALSFGLLLVASYGCGRLVSGRLAAIMSTVVIATLTPLFGWSTFAVSDSLFLPLSMLSLTCIVLWSRTAHDKRPRLILFVGSIVTGLAILTRYAGIVWLGAGILAVLLVKRKELKTSLGSAALFALPAMALTLPWSIRNRMLTGYFSGLDRSPDTQPVIDTNFQSFVETLAEDLLPSYHIGIRGALSDNIMLATVLVVAAFGTLLLIAVSLRNRYLTWDITSRLSDMVGNSKLWIPALYVASYLTFLLLFSRLGRIPPYDWSRYLAPSYPMIIILLFGLLDGFGRAALSAQSINLSRALVVVPALMLIIPNSIETTGFANTASSGQVLSSKVWRENQGLAVMDSLLDQGDIVYSDKPYAVMHYLQRPARYLPYADDTASISRLVHERPVKEQGTVYVLFFKGEAGLTDPYFRSRLTYDALVTADTLHQNFRMVAETEDAIILTLIDR